MKVKIENMEIFSDEDKRIMLILSEKDKQNITNMSPEARKYASFPSDKYTMEEKIEWMKEE